MSTTNIDTATLQSLLSTLNQLTVTLQGAIQGVPAASAPTHPAPGGGVVGAPVPISALASAATQFASANAPDPSTLAVQLATRSASLHPGNQSDPWYVVTKGKAPGVYYDVTEVNPLTVGVRRACSHKASSQAEALAAYTRAWDRGGVKVIV